MRTKLFLAIGLIAFAMSGTVVAISFANSGASNAQVAAVSCCPTGDCCPDGPCCFTSAKALKVASCCPTADCCPDGDCCFSAVKAVKASCCPTGDCCPVGDCCPADGHASVK